jgi:hypothetical protein
MARLFWIVSQIMEVIHQACDKFKVQVMCNIKWRKNVDQQCTDNTGIWAKNEAGDIQGLIVEKGMDGFYTTAHVNGLRASSTGRFLIM